MATVLTSKPNEHEKLFPKRALEEAVLPALWSLQKVYSNRPRSQSSYLLLFPALHKVRSECTKSEICPSASVTCQALLKIPYFLVFSFLLPWGVQMSTTGRCLGQGLGILPAALPSSIRRTRRPGSPGLTQLTGSRLKQLSLATSEDTCTKDRSDELDFPVFTQCCHFSSWARPDPRTGLVSRQTEEQLGLDPVTELRFAPQAASSSAEEVGRRKGWWGAHMASVFPQAQLGLRDLGSSLQKTFTGLRSTKQQPPYVLHSSKLRGKIRGLRVLL